MEDLPVPDVLEPYMPLIVGSVTAIVILTAGILVGRWAHGLVLRALERRKVDQSLVRILASLARWIVFAAAVIAALEHVGLQTTSLVALLGSAGIAIGLAIQGNLAHFASGVLLLVFRPFKVGDYIQAGGKLGIVKIVGLFTTTLVTLDNETLIIPNGAVTSSVVTNYSTTGTIRVNVHVNVVYGANISEVSAALERAAARCEVVLHDPQPLVMFVSFGTSALEFVIFAYCESIRYWDCVDQVHTAAYEELVAAGISAPFTHIVVHQAQTG